MILIKGLKLPAINGIALWPFVFTKSKKPSPVIINHEKIHLQQQLEMLILPFYIWYLLEWLLRIMQFRNLDTAYRNISFEREAYSNEQNLDYLKNKQIWSFIKYI